MHQPPNGLGHATLGLSLALAASTAGTSQSSVQASVSAAEAQSSAAPAVVSPTSLPRAISSFGAAATGDWLYVFGGHIGRAHQHSRDNIVGSFWRLNLRDGHSWEQLPDDMPLQGTALVACPDGSVIRIGGLDARNPKGEKGDLHSVADVKRFDPKTMRWAAFPPLPEPRSSHDAFVVDGKLYVCGGWNLRGKDEPIWHQTAWQCDVTAAEPKWKPMPAPSFTRRACAIARFGHRVALLGGIDDMGTTAEVSLYDPMTGQWSDAPELPGEAFGTAAYGVGDALFATVMDGRLFRLETGATEWQFVTNLTMPRFFHRMALAPDGKELIALGGASRSGHMRHIEYVPLFEDAHRMHEWTLPFPGDATYRSAIIVQGDSLLIFGGNKGRKGERFSPEQLTDEAFAIDLVSMRVRPIGKLPEARQSMAAVSWGRKPHQNLLLGGLGPNPAAENLIHTKASSFSFDRRAAKTNAAVALPSPRTQFQAVTHGHKVWVFGGTDFTPEPGGRGKSTYPLDVLSYDTKAEEPKFEKSVALAAPRRSFGAAVIGDKVYLIGGLAKGFRAAEHCEVFDFGTQEFTDLPAPPKQWVSPQVAAIGDTIYVACGGTMKGQRFAEDLSVTSYHPDRGWRTVVDELPFSTRHVQMRAVRDRLVFVDMRQKSSITLRSMRPADATTVMGAGFGH